MSLATVALSPESWSNDWPQMGQLPRRRSGSAAVAGGATNESGQSWSTIPRRVQAVAPTVMASAAGMFGVGIIWDDRPGSKNAVGRDLDLIDDHGIDVSDTVHFGDLVTHVDDMEVAKFSRTTVDKILAGARNSTVTVCFYSLHLEKDVVLELRRHVPPGVSGQPLLPMRVSAPASTGQVGNGSAKAQSSEPNFEAHFEAAGRPPSGLGELDSVSGVPLSELMRSRAPEDRGTLGVRIAMSMEQTELVPTQIEALVPGSLAHASGKLKRGDNIKAVDGIAVSEADIIAVIIGSNVIGSPCTLTMERAGKPEQFDVRLTRSSALRLQESDNVLALVDDLYFTIDKSMAMPVAVSQKIDNLRLAVVALEEKNCKSDRAMFKKLSQLAYNSPGGGREKEKKENTERKMVELSMRVEELVGGLHAARTQRDSMEDENTQLRQKLASMGLSCKDGAGKAKGVTQEWEVGVVGQESLAPNSTAFF